MSINGILISALVLAILWSIDLYVFQAVKTAISGWDKNLARQLIIWGYWVLSIGLPLSLVIGFVLADGPPRGNTLAGIISNLVITFFATKLTILLFVFGEDIYRFGSYLVQLITNSGNDNLVQMPSRRKFISQAAIITAAIPFSSFLYGITLGKYRYTIHRKTLYFNNLPDAFDGFTITQISDVHSGSFDNKEAVKRGIDLINEQQSDLFVFTGDLVNDNAAEFDNYKDIFSQIKAPYGQYSILGNHDYSEYGNWSKEGAMQNRARIRQHHQDVGFNLMLNDSTYIEKDGQRIALLGMENWGVGFSKY
ncbi:MAG: metallophosphoesterase, partial [Bacteroidetes bacterium]|nr:metallophosphoesterase [Bacteroidota bacterium]